MYVIRALAAVLALLGASMSSNLADAGGRPTYLLIQPSAAGPHTGGYAIPTTKQSYAWGYFGAQPRPHVYWQQGYYGNYHWRTTIEPFRQ